MKKSIAIALIILSHQIHAQKHTVTFKPTKYFSEFSSANAPVLTIRPGDTVYTTTVDCDGFDSLGNKLTASDAENPLTGPFYVEGATAGDILKVSLVKLSFSRNTGFSSASFHERALPTDVYKPFSVVSHVTWDLDINKMTATPRMNSAHLKNFTVKIHPFLGCVGVAPAGPPFPTTDSGPFGGNMDFTGNTAGADIYLPVYHDGALLTLGDGHATQGDGELNWDALETSLNVVFTVKVIKKPAFTLEYPRVENSDYWMAVGIDSSLDVALKIATKGLLNWVQKEYNLTNAEATQVLGSSIEYKVSEIVDPKVEIVAMIKKSALNKLTK